MGLYMLEDAYQYSQDRRACSIYLPGFGTERLTTLAFTPPSYAAMRGHERSLILLAFILPELSTAWSLPQFDFRLPFSGQPGTPEPQGVLEAATDTVGPLRIAIIGAGAGGSSAAFWIAKAKERHEQDIHVDVYEQSDYIGGRKQSTIPFRTLEHRLMSHGCVRLHCCVSL